MKSCDECTDKRRAYEQREKEHIEDYQKCYYDNKSRALEHFYTANSDLMSKRDYQFFLKCSVLNNMYRKLKNHSIGVKITHLHFNQ